MRETENLFVYNDKIVSVTFSPNMECLNNLKCLTWPQYQIAIMWLQDKYTGVYV